jgi:hypothetical protein
MRQQLRRTHAKMLGSLGMSGLPAPAALADATAARPAMPIAVNDMPASSATRANSSVSCTHRPTTYG